MGAFELDLSSGTLAQLDAFYSLLTHWNDRLHLVAPCSPEEFATRHVLESLMLLKHLLSCYEVVSKKFDSLKFVFNFTIVNFYY